MKPGPIYVTRSRQRGQGVVEFVVMIGVFSTLLLGIFQVALLYRAKATVDYAAFMAARDGALNGATQASVNTGMVKGLAPLFASEATVPGLVKAVGLAKAAQVEGLAQAQIVSPTQAMFKAVAVQQFDGVQAIPNDDLAYRTAAVRSANQLKVKVTYAYPLIVPVIDRIIGATVSAAERRPILHADGSVSLMWVLPIQAQAIVNMQSPIRDASALGGGTGVPPGNGGNNPPPPVEPPPMQTPEPPGGPTCNG